jgi:hypothetical protein
VGGGQRFGPATFRPLHNTTRLGGPTPYGVGLGRQ